MELPKGGWKVFVQAWSGELGGKSCDLGFIIYYKIDFSFVGGDNFCTLVNPISIFAGMITYYRYAPKSCMIRPILLRMKFGRSFFSLSANNFYRIDSGS